jgi:hypothetical protein
MRLFNACNSGALQLRIQAKGWQEGEDIWNQYRIRDKLADDPVGLRSMLNIGMR